MNGRKGLADNLFRESVDFDPIVFDLDSEFDKMKQGLKKPEVKEAEVLPGEISFPQFDLPEIKGVDIDFSGPDIDLGIQSPNLDFSAPDIPQVDLNSMQPDFQPAIDAAGEAIGGAANVLAEEAEPIIEPILEGAEELMGAVGSPISDAASFISEPAAKAMAETAQVVGDAMGLTAEQFQDTKVVRSKGDEYGHISIAGGVSLDVSDKMEALFSDGVKGTQLEGAEGRDLFELSTSPSSFLERRGAEGGASILADKFGMDSEMSNDLMSAIQSPDSFLAEKGEDKAIDLISKGTGVDSGTIGMLKGTLGAKDIEEAGENIAKKVASDVVVNTVAGVANAVVPGSGAVIKVIAEVFKYSCYLSTSAYTHGYISKKEYLQFTRYRMDIQANEWFSTPVWLGYIELFDKRYDRLVDDKKYAERMYKIVTNPWLRHIQYLNGVGDFSFKGWAVTQGLRIACLGSYLLHYKKANRRKANLKDMDVMKVYRRIISAVESRRKAIA